jgi:hypothetical protein
MTMLTLPRWKPRWLTDWLAVQTDRPFQANPDSHAIETLLLDIQNSMSDMALITRPHAGAEVMMPRRMLGLGLDPTYVALVDSECYRSLQETCTRCRHWRHCARDLSHGDANSGIATYCSNAEAFDRLLIARHVG